MSKSAAVLASLIEQRLVPGADVAEVDRRIHALFRERRCIVFTDMAGFSRRSARSGIIPFLVLIHQMEKICQPIVEKHAGFDMKKMADSHLFVFRDPRAALAACIEIEQAIHRYNDQALEVDHLYLGCGIGCGEVLLLGDEDIYGVEVNFAAKLGEDLAGPYQIFLTPDAVKAIGEVDGVTFRKVPGGRLGGTKLPYYEALYPAHEARHEAQRERARKSRVRFK